VEDELKNAIPTHLHALIARVAQHEVGHWIATAMVGFDAGELSLLVTD
jgi:hypothetical protein